MANLKMKYVLLLSSCIWITAHIVCFYTAGGSVTKSDVSLSSSSLQFMIGLDEKKNKLYK